MTVPWCFTCPSTRERELSPKIAPPVVRTVVLVGDPTWVAGKRGYALEFDGTGDQIDVNNFKGIIGTDPISVALWFKSTYNNAVQQQSIVCWGVQTGNARYTL